MNPSYAYRYITTATTTTIKANTLHKLQFNAAHASTVTIYDNNAASGNIIAIIPAALAAAGYVYDVALNSGFVTIVTASTSDLTVMTR